MTTVDFHQHLWPQPFQDALRARSAPPQLRGDELVTTEGVFPFDPLLHDPASRLELLDWHGIDVAVLSLQPSLGVEALPASQREELEGAWLESMTGIVAASGGRFRALAPWRAADGVVGASVAAFALVEPDAHAPLLDELQRRGSVLFVHPAAASPPGAGAPDWWSWTTDYPAQMQRAYFAWLGTGRARWPALRVVFAILAGGAPFQLERLAHRGVDVRSALDPNAYFDVATYGRRAIELCIETFGVGQLVYGSDTPVVDGTATLRSVRGFGDSVAKIVQIDTPSSLLTWQT